MAASKSRRTVSLPASVVEQVEAIARTERRSVQAVVSKALKDYAKAQAEKVAAPKARSRKKATASNGHAGPSLWDALTEPFRDLPSDVLRKLPRDGSVNHDRYIYGRP